MAIEQPQPKYRKDYTPTPYLVKRLNLDFNLNEDSTKVVAKSSIKQNHPGEDQCWPPLRCCGWCHGGSQAWPRAAAVVPRG
jgi:hypothetical protein